MREKGWEVREEGEGWEGGGRRVKEKGECRVERRDV